MNINLLSYKNLEQLLELAKVEYYITIIETVKDNSYLYVILLTQLYALYYSIMHGYSHLTFINVHLY